MDSPGIPQPPNCWRCQHFAISWDRAFPYQCRAMGFKSAITPALEVLRSDGRPCQSFALKPGLSSTPVAPAASVAPAPVAAPRRSPLPSATAGQGRWLA